MTTPAFITLADLQALYSAKEVADLQSTGPDAVSAATAIDSVNAEVEGYLSPLIGNATLVVVPAAVRVRAADMVRYYLHKDVSGVESAVYLRWKEAVRWFERVAEGKTPLKLQLADNPDTEADDVADAGGVWSEPGSALAASEWKYL